jgi:hypothetical protein
MVASDNIVSKAFHDMNNVRIQTKTFMIARKYIFEVDSFLFITCAIIDEQIKRLNINPSILYSMILQQVLQVFDSILCLVQVCGDA